MKKSEKLILGQYRKLNAVYYEKDVVSLAKDLIGKYFFRKYEDEYLIGKIVETEAYHQHKDESCHAHRGKTKRNEVMFKEAGHLYVYFIYGMHYCMNIVAEEKNVGAAVLLRAVEPVAGIETMQKLRGVSKTGKELTGGPARFAMAFAVGAEQNGADLSGDEIFIAQKPEEKQEPVEESPRIGISKAIELPWRFYLKNNSCVSTFKKRPSRASKDPSPSR